MKIYRLLRFSISRIKHNIDSGLKMIAKGNETLTFILVMIATSFIGAFVSNTGTVALIYRNRYKWIFSDLQIHQHLHPQLCSVLILNFEL